MKIFSNYSLKAHNTFGVEAKAKSFLEVSTSEEMKHFLPELKSEKFVLLGEGSNVLFKDEVVESKVIKVNTKGISIVESTKNEYLVEANAGVLWDDLVKFCVENNMGGIENLSLIPGTVGAAPIQNIGAYGQELSEVFDSLTALEIESGKQIWLSKDECTFGYRNSIFKNDLKNKVIILSVRLRLNRNPKIKIDYPDIWDEFVKLNIPNPTIKDVSRVIKRIRKTKLPDPKDLGNAGSFFKNPVISSEYFMQLKSEFDDLKGFSTAEDKVKISAAWLIDKAGLKGIKKGNVGTHFKQPLVIVNYGGATGKEIIAFAYFIKEKVNEKFKIFLEEEVNII